MSTPRAITHNGSAYSAAFDVEPDACPICHAHIESLYRYGTQIDATTVQAIFQCPRKRCSELFIATYNVSSRGASIRRVAPRTARKNDFPPSIQTLSSSFAEIYNQALSAEAHQLDQIAGTGLRKALEFLVKDFAASQVDAADAKLEIKKMFLANCIDKYIEDPNVKNVARLAVWLGNDESHYVRKWEGKDITHLKRLIQLTVNWIDNVLSTQAVIAEMTAGRP